MNNNNNLQFIKTNIWWLQLIGVSILVFSLIVIIQNPIPEFRNIRMSVMHSNANEDALILSVSLPFIFLFKNKTIKLICIIYFFYYLIFYNSTRGAIVMSSIVLIIMLYETLKKNKWIFVFIILVVSVGTADLFMQYVLNDPLFTRGWSAVENYERGNMTGRIYGILLPLFEHTLSESPIFGFGAKDYIEKVAEVTFVRLANITLLRIGRSPHNFFIMFLFNWGLVGFITILIIYFRYMYISYKIFRYDTNPITSSFFASWVAFTGMNFIANSFSYRGWTVFVLLLLSTHFLKLFYFSKKKKLGYLLSFPK